MGIARVKIPNGASTWGTIDIEKLDSQARPVYFFAANKGGIAGRPRKESDLPDMIEQYDYLFVVYASVNTGGVTSRTAPSGCPERRK